MRLKLASAAIICVISGTGCYLWGNSGESGAVLATPMTEEATNEVGEISIEVVEVVSGLTRPTAMAHAGDGSGRLFVVEKPGRVRIVQDRELLDAAFLDITDRVGSSGSEQGLLGIAFHPDYASNGYLYVNYTDLDGNTVVSRFEASGDSANADSETVILTQEQPASNHNGGQIVFGPDGYLYIGFGDGGAAGDSFGNAQNGDTLLGDMLRIDVDGGEPYAIPLDNPFVDDDAVLDEIWAMGLRNPWRFSFDRETGDLYIGDVGQGEYEEVNVVPGGEGGQNYGWPKMEGLHCYQAGCNPDNFILPVVEYSHADGCSVTGGYVYRGEQYPTLDGVYFFGDFCSGIIWGLSRDDGGSWHVANLLDTEIQLSSFGEDEAGEVYLMDLASGILYQLVGD